MTRIRAALITVAVLLISACSSKSEAPPQTPQTGGTPGSHGTLAECLHANGVPESTGPAAVLGPPQGVDPAVWDSAMKACSTLAPGPS